MGAPLGVIDSGIGGLTVAHELMRQLPDESILYFGDTARVPYGPKSPDTVRRYSREIGAFLIGEGVKAVVVACNTATAHALPQLTSELPVPVIGVIEPGARAAVRATRSGRIAIIGTVGTVRSGAYERAVQAIDPSLETMSRACPLFVPLVEEGWTDTEATRLIAESYLEPIVAGGFDTLVLGCTHYPLLKPLLSRMLGDEVTLIDSAHETAAETGRVLAGTGAAASRDTAIRHRFVASDDPAMFLQLGRRFLHGAVDRVEVKTLG